MQCLAKQLILILVIGLLCILTGCQEPQQKVVSPPDVTVCQPIEQEVTRYLEYTGTTQALEYVDIRARVPGFLEKIHFVPDTRVKAGDLLFTIDPRQYQATVDQCAATVESCKAKLRLAQTEEEIAKSLESKEAISWLKLQQASAKSGVSKADVDTALAALENARLNLDYTRVTSPINGRVSRNLVDIGNLVGATETTLLTTVVDDDSIYCYFNVSELDLLSVKRRYGVARGESTLKSRKIPAFLGLADESGYPHEGLVDYADTKLNPATGTIQVRTVFPNSNGFLLPGMFGRIRVPLEKRTALVVPGAAIQFDQGGRYVLVVNDENVVQQKRVKLGQQVEEMTVIEEGLTSKDRVIIMGVQRARPGFKVNPTVTAPAAPQSGSAAQKKPQEK